jgi:hypothetical protein
MTPPATDLRGTAERVRILVGLPLTAFLANADSVVDLGLSLERAGASGDDELHPRLQLVLRLSVPFRAGNRTARFRAWLREVDGTLGTCPAVLIRDFPDQSVGERLNAAARRYCA